MTSNDHHYMVPVATKHRAVNQQDDANAGWLGGARVGGLGLGLGGLGSLEQQR